MKLATEYATFVVGVSKDGVQQGMVYCHVKDDKRGIVSWLTATEAQELASALLEATGAEAVILPRGITSTDFGEGIMETTLTPAQKRVIGHLGKGAVHFLEIKMATRGVLINKGIITIQNGGIVVLTEYGKQVAETLKRQEVI